jgi:tripartite-type tricarboxylate transporter receptor subunit TctC
MNISQFLRLTLLAGVVGLQGIAQAQPLPDGYPNKPIKIVVPFAAGIAPDLMGRIIAEGLNKHLNVPVYVENRPGAGGNVGTEYVSRAAPDGYTLLVCGLSCASVQTFYRHLHFDVKRDLAPVINMGLIPSVLVVSQQSQLKTLDDLIKFAKANPQDINFGSPGFGTSPHLAGELLKQATGVAMTHVPYSSSDPLLDVAGGRLTFMFIPGTAALASKERLRALGVASRKRETAMPEVPAINETFKGFLMEPWNGIWAPKNTPVAVLELLNKTIQQILAEPETLKKMNTIGLTIIGGSRQDMADYFDQDVQRWKDVAKSNELSPQD